MRKLFGNKKKLENLTNEINNLKEEHKNKLTEATSNYKKAIQHKDEKIKELGELLNSLSYDINGEVVQFKDFILDKTNNVNGNLQNQSAIAEEQSASLQNVTESVQNIANRLSSSMEIVKKDSKQVENLHDNIQDIVTQMDELNNNIESITSFVNTINDIASQTNLLSINAQIESAKAGEYGRGFAVVANEINKLADKSKEASNYITKSITDIKNNSELMHKRIDGCFKASEDLLESGENRDTNISNINDEMKTIEESITEVNAGNQEATSTLVENAQNINDICQDESISPNEPVFKVESRIDKVVVDKSFGYGGYKIESGNGVVVVTCDGLIRGHIASEFFKDYSELKAQIGNVSTTTLIMDLTKFGIFANNEESRKAVEMVYRNYTEFGKVIAVIGNNALIKMQLVNILKSINLLDKYTFVDRYLVTR